LDPGTRVPILLVHGLVGSPSDFTAHANGSEDLIKRLGAIPNVFIDLFSYAGVADRWVTNPGIGQALADRIACLAAKSKSAGGIGKVVIVAHSMGGLAVREAASLTGSSTGQPASSSIGLLVTVATPNTGSWSDDLFHEVRDAPISNPLSGAAWLLQGICGVDGLYGDSVDPNICRIVQGSTSEAGTAMIPGSAQLAALPPPPADLPIDAVAGQLTVTTRLFGINKTYTLFPAGQLGDLLVKPDSALVYGSGNGRQQFTQPCTMSVSEVWAGQGWTGCTHGGLLYDPTVGAKIVSWAQSWITAATKSADDNLPPGAGNAGASSGSWSSGQPIATESTDGLVYTLSSVSCASNLSCVAVDGNGDEYTYAGGAWSSGQQIFGERADTGASVSCPLATFCIALSGSDGDAFMYSGGTWSSGQQVDPDDVPFNAISCASSSFCMAVDRVGYVVTYSNGTWSTGQHLTSADVLKSVSCPTGTFCVAVDDTGYEYTYENGAWSSANPLDTTSGFGFSSVSCASTSSCVAVGNNGYGSNDEFTYSNGTWSGGERIDPIDTYGGLASVSCPSSSFCVAVTQSGYAFTFSNDHWSSGQMIDSFTRAGNPGLTSVSCVSSSYCVAADGSGYEFTYSSAPHS
jgi:pimeloyl-ACP methyl ester carboxylesterase